jgi:cyanophycinase
MTAVAHYPQYVGIGLDEDTAMFINGEEFEVLGSGAVSVIDGGSISHSNLSDLKHGDRLELHDLTVHILPAGARFDLAARRPVVNKRVGGRAA